MAALSRLRELLGGGIDPRRWLRRPVGSPLHVCHLVDSLDLSGRAGRVIGVCNGLDPGVFLVSCLCLGDRGRLFERLEPRVQAWGLHKPDGLALGTVLSAAEILGRYRVDILHTHGSSAVGYGLAAARLARVPRRVHTGYGDGAGPVRLGFLRGVDRFTAASEEAADGLAMAWRVPREDVQVIAAGVDTERFRPAADREPLRRSLGLDPETVVVGFVGRLEQARGLETLVELVKQLVDHGCDARCLMVGEGPAEDLLRRCAEARQIASRVVLVGFRVDVTAMLAAMDLFVMPQPTPGPPMALLEAMACGLPVVAVGSSQIVRDGETGLLVPAAQPEALGWIVLELARDPERRVALGARARRHVVEHHGVEATVEAHAALYTTLGETNDASF
jgi:glycosyltransferase involved in cell wall biosynthesis